MIGVFCFHAENSDYPYYYNADEPAKARQVTTGKWNFHHPMALLSIAGLITDESLTLQQATERGRRVAAAYMALGAGLLVALAGWGFGTIGAIIAAVFSPYSSGLSTAESFIPKATITKSG